MFRLLTAMFAASTMLLVTGCATRGFVKGEVEAAHGIIKQDVQQMVTADLAAHYEKVATMQAELDARLTAADKEHAARLAAINEAMTGMHLMLTKVEKDLATTRAEAKVVEGRVGTLEVRADDLDARNERVTSTFHSMLGSQQSAYANQAMVMGQLAAKLEEPIHPMEENPIVPETPEAAPAPSEAPADIDKADRLYGNALRQNDSRAFEEALAIYTDALKAQPTNARLHFNVASILLHLDRQPEAISHLETVARIDRGGPYGASVVILLDHLK